PTLKPQGVVMQTANDIAGLAGQQPIDRHLLAALEAGLPDCSGVALGVDRVVMLALGAESIGEVLSFTVDRA
ncbi:amino acid--tRNA ligase-related protein, partial [Klebsiella michiganensis]